MAKRNKKKRTGQRLADLEQLYAKTGTLLHAGNQQSRQIRQAAIATHDRVNAAIGQIEEQLQQQLPNVDPGLAEQYGKLLQERNQLQGVIAGERQPITEQGHTPPL